MSDYTLTISDAEEAAFAEMGARGNMDEAGTLAEMKSNYLGPMLNTLQAADDAATLAAFQAADDAMTKADIVTAKTDAIAQTAAQKVGGLGVGGTLKGGGSVGEIG